MYSIVYRIVYTSKDRETLMHTQNVSKFEQERNQSRQHCILKDLQTVAVVQTVPLCFLGSCSLVFVCTHENPSVPTCVYSIVYSSCECQRPNMDQSRDFFYETRLLLGHFLKKKKFLFLEMSNTCTNFQNPKFTKNG